MSDSGAGTGASDEALLQWLARLGHDLRSPLSPIRSATQLLRADGIDAATRSEFLEVIDRQVSLLVRMAEAVSDVAHGVRGDWKLHPQRLELGVLFELAADRSARRLRETGIALEPGDTGQMHVTTDLEHAAHLLEILVQDAAVRSASGDRIVLAASQHDDAVEITLAHPAKPPDPDLLQRLPARAASHEDPRMGSALFVAARLARALGGELTLGQAGDTPGTVMVLRLPAGSEGKGN